MDIEIAVSLLVDAIDEFKHDRTVAKEISDENLDAFYDAQHAAERSALAVARSTRRMLRTLADHY